MSFILSQDQYMDRYDILSAVLENCVPVTRTIGSTTIITYSCIALYDTRYVVTMVFLENQVLGVEMRTESYAGIERRKDIFV